MECSAVHPSMPLCAAHGSVAGVQPRSGASRTYRTAVDSLESAFRPVTTNACRVSAGISARVSGPSPGIAVGSTEGTDRADGADGADGAA